MSQLLLSKKYKHFLRYDDAVFEVLEGQTAVGKTTVGLVKYLLKVARSPKRLHLLAARDVGTAEKNLINKDLGILDIFGVLVEYHGHGTADEKIPHIIYHAPDGDKIVYVLGYRTRETWERALGGQYGCMYIDEVNTAHPDFVREASMRCDYVMCTLNPDAPDLPIYSEYINHARPLPQYAADVPDEIWKDLRACEAKDRWVYWFFTFEDNAALTAEKLETIKANVPVGTKLYKNKILGLRGRATGLVFSNFSRSRHCISRQKLHDLVKNGDIRFRQFCAGVDTSYSAQSEDTIAMIYAGITENRKLIILDELVFNNSDRETPIAPSDTVQKIVSFMDKNRVEWGFTRTVFIDNADAATITECHKYSRLHGSVYDFVGSYKKTVIIDRINMQLGWLAKGEYMVVDDCTEHIHELETYSWLEDKDIPEDGHDHTVNACQYAWLPYTGYIGTQ